MFKYKTSILTSLLVGILCFSAKAQNTTKIVEKVWNGIGGKETWEKSRYIQFNFAIGKTDRKHLWDRYTGDYRLSYTNKDGKSILMLFNTNMAKEGKVYVNNVLLENTDSLKNKYLDRAYAIFINDTYWLCMPAKLQDEGVVLTALKDTAINKTKYHKLRLNFKQGIGITNDQYTIYVNAKTGVINRWTYILGGDSTDIGDWTWNNTHDIGNGLILSTEKCNADKLCIGMNEAKVLSTIEPLIFLKP